MNKARRKRLGEAFDKCAEILEILEEVKERVKKVDPDCKVLEG